jgi:hypothetical protein
MKIEELPTNDDWYDYDWREVFPSGGGDYSGTFVAGTLTGERTEDVTAERIAEIVYFHGHDNDGRDFGCIARLNDGQWAYSEAWTDYTGWGCQADAWWKVGPTLESVVAVMSEERRAEFKAQRQASLAAPVEHQEGQQP